jgi:hypothetical protein
MQTNLIVSIIVTISLILCPTAALFGRRESESVTVVAAEEIYASGSESITVISPLTGEINEI